MLEGQRKWFVLGGAVLLMSGPSLYLYRLWRSRDQLRTLAVARLSGGSHEESEKRPSAAEVQIPACPFPKSAAYLEAAAEARRKLRAAAGISKEALLQFRLAVRELVAQPFTALYVRNIARRHAFLENIPEWSSLYGAHCEELSRLVAAAERVVCADCDISETEYRDHHRAREQKDHQYMIASLKVLEGLKNECQNRPGNPLSAEAYAEVLEYKLGLARNVPPEAFPVESIRTSEYKWHIIAELAYQKFGFLGGDVPAAVVEDAGIAAQQRRLVDEFLLNSFAGMCLPS